MSLVLYVSNEKETIKELVNQGLRNGLVVTAEDVTPLIDSVEALSSGLTEVQLGDGLLHVSCRTPMSGHVATCIEVGVTGNFLRAIPAPSYVAKASIEIDVDVEVGCDLDDRIMLAGLKELCERIIEKRNDGQFSLIGNRNGITSKELYTDLEVLIAKLTSN